MPIPLPLDEVDRRRVLMVRGLFRTAVTESRAPLRSHRRIVALVGLDLATETLLKIVVGLDDDVKPRERNFHEWLREAEAVVAKLSDGATTRLPDGNAVRSIHRARNLAQHDAWPPSEETLNDATRYTRDFLRATVELVWARNIDSLSAGEAIETENSRLLIQEAEQLLVSGDVLGAARKARMGLDWAVAKAKDQRFPFRSARFGSGPERHLESDIESLWRVAEELLLGLNDAEESRLARMTGWRIGPRSDNWRDPREPIDVSGAEWAVGYCTDAILTLEQRFGGALLGREGRTRQ